MDVGRERDLFLVFKKRFFFSFDLAVNEKAADNNRLRENGIKKSNNKLKKEKKINNAASVAHQQSDFH